MIRDFITKDSWDYYVSLTEWLRLKNPGRIEATNELNAAMFREIDRLGISKEDFFSGFLAALGGQERSFGDIPGMTIITRRMVCTLVAIIKQTGLAPYPDPDIDTIEKFWELFDSTLKTPDQTGRPN